VIPEDIFGVGETGRSNGSLSRLAVLPDEGPDDETVGARILLTTQGAGGGVGSAAGW